MARSVVVLAAAGGGGVVVDDAAGVVGGCRRPATPANLQIGRRFNN